MEPTPLTARPAPSHPRVETGTSPQALFVFRLRLHRERHRISLFAIASATRIKRELLEELERNDLSGWPRGVYARAWVRAYASLVGLDPIDTVDEFCRLFPHGDRRAGGTLREIAAIVAHTSEYQDEFRETERRRGTPRVNTSSSSPVHAALAYAAHALWMALKPSPSSAWKRAPAPMVKRYLYDGESR